MCSIFFRITAAISRLPFPVDSRHHYLSRASAKDTVQPAHSVVLKPPITIVNLLPYDIFYYLASVDTTGEQRFEKVEGVVKPGKEAAVHQVDLSERLEFGLNMEHLKTTSNLQVSLRQASPYVARMTLLDAEQRALELKIKIAPRQASIKV